MHDIINLSQDWKFILEKDCGMLPAFGFRKCALASGPAAVLYHEGMMRSVDLPHDWAIELAPDPRANTGRGGRPVSRFIPLDRSPDGDTHVESVSIGWYRKHFTLMVQEGQRVFLEFEGVFRDYAVFVNGIYIDRHQSGYTPAVFDVTDQIKSGQDNVLAVRVDASQPEGWWYEGAGIYRPVYLHIKEEVYLPHHSIFVQPEICGEVKVSFSLASGSFAQQNREVYARILDHEGKTMAESKTEISVLPRQAAQGELSFSVTNPTAWDIENPYLYTLEMRVGHDGGEAEERVSFGFRTVRFDANEGMFLNGRHVKLRGACIHQDFGGFGVAVPRDMARYKIKLLKEMGVNAYRASHHPASKDILEACDELGMLVIDEVRLFGASPEALRQLEVMVTAHRNHPSIFIWSLGNEEFGEYIQSSDFGERMEKTAYQYMRLLDPTRLITYGANNGSVDTGANAVVDVRGFNYVRNLERLTHDKNGNHLPGYNADRYHREHPTVPMMGTEEGSHFHCRGAGVNNHQKGEVAAIGENTAMGGSTPEGWVKFYEKRPYLAGGFMWTGMDYYGEPCPFTDKNFSSSFGALDLVGIPKNTFEYYRSCWTEDTVLSIMPHWDFEEGQTAKIAVYSNCETVSLWLNGALVGERHLEKFDSAIFEIPFVPGKLEAKGVREGKEYTTSIETPSAPHHLALTERREGDVAVVDVFLQDKEGRLCSRADREVTFSLLGEGKILGVGNGNPSSAELDQILETEELTSISNLKITQNGATKPYTPSAIDDMTGVLPIKGVDSVFKGTLLEPKHPDYEDNYRLVWQFKAEGEAPVDAVFTATVENAEDYSFLQFERLFGEFEVWLNGELLGKSFPSHFYYGATTKQSAPYRFDCHFKTGKNLLEVKMKGMNTSQMGIYGGAYLGKRVKPQWKRSTFYGRARVFVELKDGAELKLLAEAEDVASASL